MIKDSLPSNVYRLPQNDFSTIPGSPWVYWISDSIRDLFKTLPSLGELAQPRQGLATADNLRFLRYWWEIGQSRIAFRSKNREYATSTGHKWFPIAKGSKTMNWAGTEYEIINWQNNGKELNNFDGSVIRNPEFYFKPGITLTRVGPSGFSSRINPGGYLFDSSNSGSFPETIQESLYLLGILNSKCTSFLLMAMNPTINFQVGDLTNLPLPKLNPQSKQELLKGVQAIIFLIESWVTREETAFDFVVPLFWSNGLQDLISSRIRLANLEAQIDLQVYRLYSISPKDRAAIEAELAVAGVSTEESDDDGQKSEGERADDAPPCMSHEELAARWISYAVGVVLGRFQPGVNGALGSAIYCRSDFAIGSLPAPDEAEFDEFVGSSEHFAYIDKLGRRHVFAAQVEHALQALVQPDGIANLDEDHERDLTTRVGKALEWMLGEQGAQEVIQQGAGGDLRSFLNKDYFTQYHLRWYRKRPVYWYIQSAKRSFGFVLFHEKIDKNTFYTLQHEVANKRKAIQFQLEDLQKALLKVQGSQRKQVEKNSFELRQFDEELSEFAQALEAITSGGYEPEPSWIDDGIILRMAPLWQVIPLWKNEPKKYWEALQESKYDWSHIAMHYWPERVCEKCRTDKSFAIAHGHEEWFERR